MFQNMGTRAEKIVSEYRNKSRKKKKMMKRQVLDSTVPLSAIWPHRQKRSATFAALVKSSQ